MRKLKIEISSIADWPAADQSAWHLATQDGGLFGSGGALAHHSETRLARLSAAYGRWIGSLREAELTGAQVSGVPFTRDSNCLATFLHQLQVVAPCTARGYLTDLLTACRALDNSDSFTLLHRAVRHAWRTAKPVTDKINRMVPARDLYQLGLTLMGEAEDRSTPLKRAGQYRDGLMIAMLAAAPARISNFVSIRLGRHIVRGGARYRLIFAADEVKTRRHLEYALPADLTARIEVWLNVYRLECASRRGRWHSDHDEAFWLSNDGGPYRRASQVRERIERVTLEKLGKRINPHLFRDIAATSIASELPAEIGIVRPVLGHADARSGQRFYNQAGSIRAARTLQGVLQSFRSNPTIPTHPSEELT